MTRNHIAGFTVLEMLVSIAVLATVSIALASTLDLGRRVWERSGGTSDLSEHALSRGRVRSLVEAIPMPTGRESIPIFQGDVHGFESISLPEDGSANLSEPIWFALTVGELAGANVALEERGLSPSDKEPYQIQRLLTSGDIDVSFQYFGSQSPLKAANWYQKWESTEAVPILVKLEFSFEGVPVLPPLTLQPALVERQRLISLSSLVPPG